MYVRVFSVVVRAGGILLNCPKGQSVMLECLPIYKSSLASTGLESSFLIHTVVWFQVIVYIPLAGQNLNINRKFIFNVCRQTWQPVYHYKSFILSFPIPWLVLYQYYYIPFYVNYEAVKIGMSIFWKGNSINPNKKNVVEKINLFRLLFRKKWITRTIFLGFPQF